LATGGEQLFQRATRAMVRATLRRGTSPPIATACLRRILVVRTDDRVGNVLLTTPLMRALREGLPHVAIDWLIASRRSSLVDGLFLADSLVPYERKKAARNPIALGRLLWRLRSAQYDAVIDAAHYDTFSLTAALMTRWSGAPIRIGHERGDAAHYYTHPVAVPSDPYDVAAKLSLLEPLGLRSCGYEMETCAGTSQATKDRADALLAQVGVAPGGFFIVNPGARKTDRRFPANRMGEFSKRIAEASGLTALIVWGPGEEELAQDARHAAGAHAFVAPPTDLDLLAALLRRSALLLTNDTGPMHLGVACGAPTLALFTQEDWWRWGHPIPSFRALDAREGKLGDVSEVCEAALDLLKPRTALVGT
jgi:heptosyltransferase-3